MVSWRAASPLALCHALILEAVASSTGMSSPRQDLFLDSDTCGLYQRPDVTPSQHGPWTHEPRCYYPSSSLPGRAGEQEVCIFTDAAFRSRTGISIITTPDVADYLLGLGVLGQDSSSQTFQDKASGSRPVRPYELRELPSRGIGLYANTSLEPGEVILVDTPALIVAQQALQTLTREDRQDAQWTAVLRLPDNTRRSVRGLAKARGGDELDAVLRVNAVGQSYGNDIRHLALLPRMAVSRMDPGGRC